MTVLAAEGAAGAGAGAAEGGGLGSAAAGSGIGAPSMPSGSVAFAIAILLIGFACMGLWIAFHKPENAETGAFPGLFGQMLQWVHAGEESAGASASEAPAAPSPSELQQIKNLPSSFLKNLQKLASGGGPLGQWGQWFLHLPGI
jgi:hypothetical protein